jgi:hypothetical protein
MAVAEVRLARSLAAAMAVMKETVMEAVVVCKPINS